MARRIARGEIWLHRFAPPDKRRPVLVLSRQDALDFTRDAMVAPVTSTIRGLPSEVALGGVDQGLKGPCAANLDHVQTIPQAELRSYVSTLRPEVMAAVCRALAIAAGCA